MPYAATLTTTTLPFACGTDSTRRIRLWHLRRLEAKERFNETWVSDNSCYGHNPGDKQPFHNLFSQNTAELAEEPKTDEVL